ncbi:MAG: hypothetical protein PUC84_04950 [Clostridiales bacterium]|nr:hypothetical protein [Clostridium sp.]MDD5878533.1 hypothetical protein [Clostridiales bacterium]
MKIDIKDYKLLCHKGSGEYNEDIVRVCKYGAWILDGSTGLNKKNLISKESDAKWYVSWWDKYLYENINKDKSLKTIVCEGIENIKQEYLSTLAGIRLEKLDMPSASVAIVKFYKDKVEYFLLGDCTIVINDTNENIILKDDGVCKFDNMIFEKMKKLNKNKSLSVKDKKDILLPYIIENRLKKNSEEGYWILEFDELAVEKSMHDYISINDELKLIISSDGFSCAYDRYNIFSVENIIQIVEENGIEYVNDKVRKLEHEDKNGLIFPRFKESDDSSCAYLHITKK